MLTRKYFYSIAGIIKGIPAKMELEYDDIPVCEQSLKLIANDLADYFAEDNPQFNRERFITACDLIQNSFSIPDKSPKFNSNIGDVSNIWNLKETNEEIKETKELSKIIEVLKDLEPKHLEHMSINEFYLKKARELKKLMNNKNLTESKGRKVIPCDKGICDICNKNNWLYMLEGLEDSDIMCNECFCDWLVDNNIKLIC